HSGSVTSMVNEVNLMTPRDCFFAIALWKSSRSIVRLAEAAHEKGAKVLVIADRRNSLTEISDEFALVPAESSELISSLVCATSAIEYLLGCLARRDEERTQDMLGRIDELWGITSAITEEGDSCKICCIREQPSLRIDSAHLCSTTQGILMNLTFVFVLIAYVAIMLANAAWFGRASAMKDGEDFVLAGKSLPTWVLAGTLLATFVGSGSIIGGANFIFSNGPLAGMLFFGGTFCGIIVLYFIAPKVRENGFRTVPELFESNFGRPVRVAGTIIVLVAFIGITAYQFTGAGYILTLITPLSATQATIVATVLITFLSLSGGLKS